MRKRPAGPAYRYVSNEKGETGSICLRKFLTPITTTSYFSLAPVWVPVRGVSLGRGAARDGRILKSRPKLAFSWNTGIIKIAEEEEE